MVALPDLKGVTLEHAQTEFGSRDVEDLIGRIQHGSSADFIRQLHVIGLFWALNCLNGRKI